MANETGLTTKYISQVEKAEVMPPVAVILRLSRALEIDSSILLDKKRSGRAKSRPMIFKKELKTILTRP